jgi:hypothetical protein
MLNEHRVEAILHAIAIWTLSAALLVGSSFLLWAATAVTIRVATAPMIAAVVASVFFTKYDDARPLGVAITFTATVALLDAIVLAALIQRSAAIFVQPLATWVPYALIFATTWMSGALMAQPPAPASRT